MRVSRSYVLGVVITLAVALSTCFTTVASAQTLGISGNRFTVDGQPRYLVFLSYFDALDVDGGQAIADFDYFVSRGVDGIRILPNWLTVHPATFASDTLIRADGQINEGTFSNLVWYLDRARERGLLVDLTLTADTISSFIDPPQHPDYNDITFSNYLDGVRRVAERLTGYRNMLFDIQNEANLNGPDHRTPLSDGQIIQIKNAVKSVDPGRIVTASFDQGQTNTGAASRANNSQQDVASWHEDRVQNFWTGTRSRLQQMRAITSKPIYLQEPERFRQNGPEDGTGPGADNSWWLTAGGLIEAVREAKKGCAAAWTFHTAASHFMNGSNWRDRRRGPEFQFMDEFKSYLNVTDWCEGQTPPPGGPDFLMPGGVLYPNQSINSPSTGRQLLYQTDGNLVIYNASMTPEWAISCLPTCIPVGPPGLATMQTDGNFVVYNSSGTPVFHTGTWGNPGAYLWLRNDGNLFVLSAGGGVLWSRF
jgi:hypothetical protein